MALSIQKILETNLPSVVDEDVILFTDEGNIYVNREDGSLAKMGGSASDSSSGSGGGSSDSNGSASPVISELSCVNKLPNTAKDGKAVLLVGGASPIMSVFYKGVWYGQGFAKVGHTKGFLTAEEIALFEHDGVTMVVSQDATVSDFYSKIKINNGGVHGTQKTLTGTFTTGEGVLRIPWKVSSEANYDFGYIYIDGEQLVSASGSTYGTIYKRVSAGEHTLKVTYKKDGSGTSGEDAITLWGIEYYV